MRIFIVLLLSLCSSLCFAQNAAYVETGRNVALVKADTTISTTNEYVQPVRRQGYATAYLEGSQDAELYYKGYKGSGTGTLLVSLVSPLVGLIPAIACSSTPPQDTNLMYPSAERFKETDYRNGYSQRAKKIKSKKVWTNWGIAFGVNLLFVLALSSN